MAEFERLTKRFSNGVCENDAMCAHSDSEECMDFEMRCSDGCKWNAQAWERLAAYEDSGLTPESIMKLGKADAEVVRRGEWVKDGIDDDDEGHYYCSSCNSAEFFDDYRPFSKYCPSCGALMDLSPSKSTGLETEADDVSE